MRQPSEIILADGRTLQEVLNLRQLRVDGFEGKMANLTKVDLYKAQLYTVQASYIRKGVTP